MNREFIGYIYKVTNVITGEYYFGKREYRKDNKLKLGEIYLGSGKDILENIYRRKGQGISEHNVNVVDDTLAYPVEEKIEYTNEDNTRCRQVWDDGYEEIFEIS